MSMPTTEITTEIKEKLEFAQLTPAQKLIAAIRDNDQHEFHSALKAGASINDIVELPDGELSHTPLGYAVLRHNRYAVQQLIIAGADANIRDGNGIPLLLVAIDIGNSNIVDEILQALKKQNIHINSIYKNMSALTRAILCIPSFSLIHNHNSIWSASSEISDLKTRLKNWYRGHPEDFSDTELRVQYSGNSNIIGTLLQSDIDIEIPSSKNITPLMLLENPSDHFRTFMLPHGKSAEFKGCTDGVLKLKITIENLEEQPLIVTVEYDLKPTLALVKAHQARLANRPAIRRASFDDLRKAHAAVVERVTPVCAAQDIKDAREKRITECYTLAPVFFDRFTSKLNDTLTALKVLNTGEVAREKGKPLDTAASIVHGVADFIPNGFGTPVKIAAMVMQKFSDRNEGRKAEQTSSRMELDHIPFCEDLAVRIIEEYKNVLVGLNPDDAKKMADDTVKAVIKRLANPKPLPAEKSLIETIIKDSVHDLIHAEKYAKPLLSALPKSPETKKCSTKKGAIARLRAALA